MNAFFKLTAASVCIALISVALRRQNAELSTLLGIAGCCFGGFLIVSLLPPILSFVESLFQETGLEKELLTPLLKMTGIGLLAQIAAAVCIDAGETALAKIVELGGTVLCISAGLPVLNTGLQLVLQLMGG